jgi:acetyl-CoA synthetase
MVKYVVKRGDRYYPSEEMKKIAWINSDNIYKESNKNPVKFWENLARQGLSWSKFWKTPYEEKLPYFKWFKGGKLNVSFNCLDRHINIRGRKNALIWVPEPTSEKTIKISYEDLNRRVNKFANVLRNLGARKGSVVTIYLPLIPEIVISMLACARIGAIHSVVFSAFSDEALKTRINDGKSKILITANGYYRKGKKEDLLKKVNSAIEGTKIKKVVVVNRLKKNIKYGKKFVSYENELKKAENYCEPEVMNSEDPLFILYTSGTTGKPKGVIHDSGGYLTHAYWSTKWNFNLHEQDVIWCTADIGWITGHTYSCYGPLSLGSTFILYEGALDFPKPDRWWKIIEENNVNVFYTAPTAIRMFMKLGDNWVKKYKLKSLKILGTVGEPIDEDSWQWYFEKVGKNRLPIIDTWWQTETGGTMINALPGVGPFIPGVASRSFPGVRHEIVNEKGNKSKKGFLVQLSPFAPGMLHGVFGNKKKYREAYWSRFKGKYDTSDGAFYYDKDNIRITGRVDDVIKVAGHRLSSGEMENAIDEDILVGESAVVGIPDKVRGEVPVAFVVLKKKDGNERIEANLIKRVRKKIGPTATPKKIYFVNDLPKTRSGKIMRRILRNLLTKEPLGGVSTLVNPSCVDKIKETIG